jgi:hypothetical protein
MSDGTLEGFKDNLEYWSRITPRLLHPLERTLTTPALLSLSFQLAESPCSYSEHKLRDVTYSESPPTVLP